MTRMGRRIPQVAALRTFSPRNEGHGFWNIAVILALFGVLNLVTGLVYDAYDKVVAQQVIRGEATVGPITITEPNTVLIVTTAMNLRLQNWAFGEAVLLDADGEDLASFGDELWNETGVDSGERWYSSRNEFKQKITVPQPGTYRIGFQVQLGKIGQTRGVIDPNASARVTVTKAAGSSLPHLIAGFGLLFLSVMAQGLSDHRVSLFTGMLKIVGGCVVVVALLLIVF